MPLFGSSKKSPVELVKIATDAILTLEKEPQGSKKAEKVSIYLRKNCQCVLKTVRLSTIDVENNS